MVGRHVDSEAVSVLVGQAAHQAGKAVAGEGTVGLDVVLQGVGLAERLAAYPTLPRTVAHVNDVIDGVVFVIERA